MEQQGSVDLAALIPAAHEARAAYRFTEADALFAEAQQHTDLSTEDILAWGDAAWWSGRTAEALRLAELAHHRLLAEHEPIRAAMQAINLGFLLMVRGELAAGSGWMQRGRSLVEASRDDHAMGYVLQLDAEQALEDGDVEGAAQIARRAEVAGRRAADAALTSLALMTEGKARLRTGALSEAMALLDEAMLPIQAGRIPADVAGNLFCQMIEACWDLADLRRAREWTAATQRWCEQFDSSVMFSGICRMHRVQLRQVAGEWDAAQAEAEVVCHELADMNIGVVAEGHYLLGDVLRLRGVHQDAEAAYRRAHELGRDPQPGLALLRAQAGQVPGALASLRTALAAHDGAGYRLAPLLRAVVDLAIEAGVLDEAAQAAEELAAVAGRWGTDGLRAAAAHAQGAVAVASGEPSRALGPLREAVRAWQAVDAPYDAARARILLAQACAALDDDEAARLEMDTATAVLRHLGAQADLRRLQGPERAPADGHLTAREAEILALVAEGGTNRQVAQHLAISEKTVARHLANIYVKLDVSTRTAAAAWARRNGLRQPPA